MAKKKAAKKTQNTVAGKDIFLATLGFYGKVYEQGADRVSEINEKRQSFFQDLVNRGEKLEDQAKGKYEELKTDNPKIDERIDTLRNNFSKLKETFSKKEEKAAPKKASTVAKAA